MYIKPNATILFQGDSITDVGRSRETDDLGSGYPNYVAALFNSAYPELNVKFINKGISGNRVIDLKNRWTEDCIALAPDVVSILIGVNDTWRRYDSNDETSAEAYYEDYKTILSRVKDELGDVPIIILEPFLLPYPEDRIKWRVDLDPKIQMARKVAKEFGATYIPLDGIFASKCMDTEYSFWAADGVHPTSAGHALIARAWLEAIGY